MDDDVEIIEDEDAARSAVKRLQEKLAASEQERKEYLEGWQRAKADLINFRREETARLTEAIARSECRLIEKVFPVLDSLDRALGEIDRKHLSPEVEKGLELIHAQFREMLRGLGVEPIEAEGKPFDPALHEAVEEVEAEGPPGTVVQELERGYRRGEFLLRPAKVKISRDKNKF